MTSFSIWTISIFHRTLESMAQSSRTLLIISPSFLQSQFARSEFLSAFNSGKVLLLKRKGALSEDFVKQYRRLVSMNEEDRNFYQNLIFNLPHKPIRFHHSHQLQFPNAANMFKYIINPCRSAGTDEICIETHIHLWNFVAQ